MAGLLNHLRCHPIWRAAQRVVVDAIGRAGCRREEVLLEHLGRAKVGELAHTDRVDEDVGALDVTVHYTLGVEVGEAK